MHRQSHLLSYASTECDFFFLSYLFIVFIPCLFSSYNTLQKVGITNEIILFNKNVCSVDSSRRYFQFVFSLLYFFLVISY